MSFITFDFKCQTCGNVEERMVRRSEVGMQFCDCVTGGRSSSATAQQSNPRKQSRSETDLFFRYIDLLHRYVYAYVRGPYACTYSKMEPVLVPILFQVHIRVMSGAHAALVGVPSDQTVVSLVTVIPDAGVYASVKEILWRASALTPYQ